MQRVGVGARVVARIAARFFVVGQAVVVGVGVDVVSVRVVIIGNAVVVIVRVVGVDNAVCIKITAAESDVGNAGIRIVRVVVWV